MSSLFKQHVAWLTAQKRQRPSQIAFRDSWRNWLACWSLSAGFRPEAESVSNFSWRLRSFRRSGTTQLAQRPVSNDLLSICLSCRREIQRICSLASARRVVVCCDSGFWDEVCRVSLCLRSLLFRFYSGSVAISKSFVRLGGKRKEGKKMV